MSGIPRRFSFRDSRLWKSGKSMSTAASGRRSAAAASREDSARRTPGTFSTASLIPTTERASERATGSSPAETRRSPPMPNARIPGRSTCSAPSRRAPWRSPDASPAERSRFSGGSGAVMAAGAPASLLGAERVHEPRDGETAEHERGQQNPEELPALPPFLAPEKGEERRHEERVDDHDEEVIGRDQGHHRFFPA